ncbi:MAG: FAD:protein FMN transferase [Halieaceae bacterium]|jgi:FAD:protein FMN transferase|nr:FAD:protein FMN transferase [Halieaceae bacterium]
MIPADGGNGRLCKRLFCSLAILCLMVQGCAREQDVERLSGHTMGTTWHVSYIPGHDPKSPVDLQRKIEQALDRVNRSMSTYRDDSEISRLNAAAQHQWIAVSPAFARVLEAALAIGDATGGAYDVTVGPLVSRWGFGPAIGAQDVPPGAEIDLLLERVGQRKLRLDRDALKVLKTADLSLDFSSIAKGYGVDRVAGELSGQSIHNYLIEIGGEVRVSGVSGRGDPWRIAIEQPDSDSRDPALAISLTDRAVATSGDYRNFFEAGGVRYSHSIDPRTGYPVKHDLVSVTVVHERAMEADAWATALIVLGTERAMALASAKGLAAYFIRRKNGEYVSASSPAFAAYLKP